MFDMEKQRDLDLKRARAIVEELGSKFDSVQVFVSRHDPTTDSTISVEAGTGNWHARRGQVREWVLKGDELARRKAVEDDDEDE